MPSEPLDVFGWDGVDNTTDPFVLGKTAPKKSALAYNYRTRHGVRTCRNGLTPVINFSSGQYLKKSGVYFPPQGRAILPFTKDSFNDSFYLAGLVEYTIEFWYRGEFQAYDRTLFTIPCDFGAGLDKHLTLVASPTEKSYPTQTNLIFYAMLGNGDSPETIGMETYTGLGYIPMDDEWHHIALIKYAGDENVYSVLDNEDQSILSKSVGSPLSGYYNLNDASWKNLHDSPHYYNYLLLGGDGVSMADFRMWSVAREPADVYADMNDELVGDEEYLVCYVPLNEGTGVSFTDRVSGAIGHFTPQEPYVNDDYELVFTGYNCMAYPSLRSFWILPEGETESTHKLGNDEAAYDGGILWDTKLNLASVIDYSEEGVWMGTAQIRLRLQQLKEGVLCGRLGMLYDRSEEKYRLFFFDETNAVAYTSQAMIDENWIGVEHTITVAYYGISTEDTEDICGFYIDGDGATNYAQYSPSCDFWGDTNDTALTATAFKPFIDTEGENESGGAVGGCPDFAEMCVAFDLIFLRQWFGNYADLGTATFLEDTYNVDDLGDSFRYVIRGFNGYINRGTTEVVVTESAEGLFAWGTEATVGFIYIPITDRTFTYNMDGNDTYLIIDGDTVPGHYSVPKQDILVKRIHDYYLAEPSKIRILYSPYTYDFAEGAVSTWGDKLHFNGAFISTLVNDYNWKTFKLKKERRSVFTRAVAPNFESADHETRDIIEDDSPLQSLFGQATGTSFKTRFLILGVEDRHYNITGYVSIRPRWCDSPVIPIELPAVRGIYRYTSEDKEIDRLVVAAHSAIYELDPDAETVTAQKWAWMDQDDDSRVKFLAVNNTLVAMDNNSGLKLNFKGNWSRLGIEVPRDIAIIPGDTSPGGVFEDEGKYAWVAQFVDSENNTYSGTIPVFWRQGLLVDAYGTGLSNCTVLARSCKDYNVDKIYYYRTLNYTADNLGTLEDLFLCNKGYTNKYLGDYTTYRDVWTDENLAEASFGLPTIYYGQDLVPKPCKGIGVGYNRVFLFNSKDSKSSLYWSMPDALGFPKPDQFPSTYRLIVEEGDTTEGTAVIEFSHQVFAFKENAIFLVSQNAAASFSAELVYKGVGCVNQSSVTVAGNSIVFIDRSGVYRYSGGEPNLLSPDLSDYFRNEINQDNVTDVAFLLFNKTDDILYAFLPSTGSAYCDRVIVFDMRSQKFSIDFIPYVTCGYVDHEDIYLGTPYGQVLRVSETTYLDGVSTSYSGTGAML